MDNGYQALQDDNILEDDVLRPLTEPQDTEMSSVSTAGTVGKRKKIVRKKKPDEKELDAPIVSGSGREFGQPSSLNSSDKREALLAERMLEDDFMQPLTACQDNEYSSVSAVGKKREFIRKKKNDEKDCDTQTAGSRRELGHPSSLSSQEKREIVAETQDEDPESDSWIASFDDVYELMLREAKDPDDASVLYFFIHKSDLLSLPSQPMPSFKDCLEKGLLHPHEIELIKVLRGLYRKAFAAVSYRWETPEHPDRSGDRLTKIRKLAKTVDSQWFFIDYMCMPQDVRRENGEVQYARSGVEKAYHEKALQGIPMLYLGADVLLIVEKDYNRRFWCVLEAYLAMREADDKGLSLSVLESGRERRHHFAHSKHVDEETDPSMPSSLENEMKDSPDCMFERLNKGDFGVTRREDKTVMVSHVRLLERLIQKTWSQVQEHDNYSASLLTALLDKNVKEDEIRSLLSSKARPDDFWVKPDYTVRLPCPPLQSVSPLPLSVLQNRLDITKLLVAQQASLDHQRYSFKAGIEQLEWSGTAIHIAVAAGNLDLIKELVALGACLKGPHSEGSNGANLVWQSAYFGHHRTLSYLLDNGVEVKNPASFPDDSSLILYPMHVASLKGHEKVIRLLARHKADLDIASGGEESDPRRQSRRQSLCYSEGLKTPLEFAIDKSQVDSVRVLVELGANLLGAGSAMPLQRLSGSGQAPNPRPVELLFKEGNSVVITAAAEGLRRAHDKHKRWQMKMMTHEDLISFLETCGEAASHIVSAIFAKLTRFTYLDFESKQRIMVKSAYLEDYGWGKINAAVGPGFEVLNDHVERRLELTQEQTEFLREFVPQEKYRNKKELRRVDLWQCLVKDIDSDPLILDAFTRVAKGNEGWFMSSGVQAIAELHWRQAQVYARVTIAVQVFHVICLVGITAAINQQDQGSRLVTLVIFPALLQNVIEEVLELYVLKARKYWGDSGNWLAWLRISQEVVVVVSLLSGGDGDNDNKTSDDIKDWVRCSVAICVLLHWMKLLGNLKTVASVGYMVAPITTAIQGIVGICIVTLVYLLAFTHAYWALNRYNFWKSFIRMWSLGLLGDFDFADLENNESGDDTEMGLYVRIGFLVMSFSMSIVITNIFIGVLGNGYNQALENAWGIFLYERAYVTVYIECIIQHFKPERDEKEPKYIYYCEEADRNAKDSDDEHDKQKRGRARLDTQMVRQIMQEEMKDLRVLLEKNSGNDEELQSPQSRRPRMTLARDLGRERASMRMSFSPSTHTSLK